MAVLSACREGIPDPDEWSALAGRAQDLLDRVSLDLRAEVEMELR